MRPSVGSLLSDDAFRCTYSLTPYGGYVHASDETRTTDATLYIVQPAGIKIVRMPRKASGKQAA